MKDESKAWRSLEEHASAQLRGDFAGRILRAGRGPTEAAWRELGEVGAAQLRAGFADRVLRAVRQRMPSLTGQLALGAVTLAACVAFVILVGARTSRIQEERNLANWQQLATEAQYFGLRQ